MKKHYSEKQLMAFVDDELGESEYNLIKEHLKTCGRCAGYVEGLQTMFENLDGLASPPATKKLADNTVKLWKLLHENDIQQTENRFFVGIKRAQKYMAIGAMAAGLAFGFLFGDIARKGLIGEESFEQNYPVVLQENDDSINDTYVSLIIGEGRDDL